MASSIGTGTAKGADSDDLFASYEPRASSTSDAYDDEVDPAEQATICPPTSPLGSHRSVTGGSQATVPPGSSDTSQLNQRVGNILEDDNHEDREQHEEEDEAQAKPKT